MRKSLTALACFAAVAVPAAALGASPDRAGVADLEAQVRQRFEAAVGGNLDGLAFYHAFGSDQAAAMPHRGVRARAAAAPWACALAGYKPIKSSRLISGHVVLVCSGAISRMSVFGSLRRASPSGPYHTVDFGINGRDGPGTEDVKLAWACVGGRGLFQTYGSATVHTSTGEVSDSDDSGPRALDCS